MEILVTVIIICMLVAIMFPAIQAAREAARKTQCVNNLKQIGLALHTHAQLAKTLPPGCVVSLGTYPAYDPWTEASTETTESGWHGTSWMLAILPQLEETNVWQAWDFAQNVRGNAAVAQRNIALFYCPSRRNALRVGDAKRLLDSSWTGGGNDYGGCLGAGNGWSNDSTSDNHHMFAKSAIATERWDYPAAIGMFPPNIGTGLMAVKDGTSNTIMTGELQRLDGSIDQRTSQDGWALGGVATLFTTAKSETNGVYQTGGLNNNFFESAGSDHPGGANFGMGDGSVRFLANGIDTQVFHWLGAIDDGHATQVP